MAGRGRDRLAARLLDGMGRQLWGFPPRLLAAVVDHLGPIRALVWFSRNMPRYERTRRIFGPLRTHLACLVVALHNGCRYCAFGHAHALELVYFRDRDRLFPHDAQTLTGWIGLPPAELRDRLCSVLQQAGLPIEVLWVDRTLALASGAQRPIDTVEARLAHLVRMLGVFTSTGVCNEVGAGEAHDPIDRDDDLKLRHAALRETAR